MSTLYFEDETNYHIFDEPETISTTFMNNDGKKIYLMLYRGEETNVRTMTKDGKKPLKTPIKETMDDMIVCRYASIVIKEGEEGEEEEILDCQRRNTGLKFTLENILKFTNENCNCSFTDVVILEDGSGYESATVATFGEVTFNLMENYKPKNKEDK